MDVGGNNILMDMYWSQACRTSAALSSSSNTYMNGVLGKAKVLCKT